MEAKSKGKRGWWVVQWVGDKEPHRAEFCPSKKAALPLVARWSREAGQNRIGIVPGRSEGLKAVRREDLH